MFAGDATPGAGGRRAATGWVATYWAATNWRLGAFAASQGLTLAFGALLFLRRSAGAIESPPSLVAAGGAALAVLLLGIAARELLASVDAEANPRRIRWRRWVPAANAAFVAGALAPPTSLHGAVPLVWTFTIVGEALWQLAGQRRAKHRSSDGTARSDRGRAFAPQSAAPATKPRSGPAVVAPHFRGARPSRVRSPGGFVRGGPRRRVDGGRAAGELRQQMTRRAIAAGAEEITGVVAISMEMGQRHATTHVAFCPPLATAPLVQCQLHDVSGASSGAVKASQVQPYGARFDVKLTGPAAAAGVHWIVFTARDATAT